MISFDKKSWVLGSEHTEFPIQNIPFGIYSTASKSPRIGTAIGNKVLDIHQLAVSGLIALDTKITENISLNDFISLGKSVTNKIRLDIANLLDIENNTLKDRADLELFMDEMAEVTMHLPVKIGDYTDFYSSRQHATNVGIMFRDPANALLPNWLHKKY